MLLLLAAALVSCHHRWLASWPSILVAPPSATVSAPSLLFYPFHLGGFSSCTMAQGVYYKLSKPCSQNESLGILGRRRPINRRCLLLWLLCHRNTGVAVLLRKWVTVTVGCSTQELVCGRKGSGQLFLLLFLCKSASALVCFGFRFHSLGFLLAVVV